MSRHIERSTEIPEATLQRLQSRIDGRRAAGELHELIAEHHEDAEFLAACVERLAYVTGVVEKPSDVQQEEQHEPIARLGSTMLPFGQYNGVMFDHVPLEYLDWLCREQEGFYRTLRAYLKHPQLEQHRGEYDDEG